MRDERIGKRIQHTLRVELSVDLDRQALAGVFIDDDQHPERLAIKGAILDEVIRPDVVRVHRPKPNARSIGEPQTPAPGLFHWHSEPLAPPYPIDALDVHHPTFSVQQRGDPAVAVTAVLLGKAGNRFGQRIFALSALPRLALGGAVLADHAARPAHRDAEALHHVVDTRTAA